MYHEVIRVPFFLFFCRNTFNQSNPFDRRCPYLGTVDVTVPKPVIKDNKVYYEVQWKGYRETTLEPRENLLVDVPKMVNLYEKKNKIKLYDSKNKKTNKVKRRIYNGKKEDE